MALWVGAGRPPALPSCPVKPSYPIFRGPPPRGAAGPRAWTSLVSGSPGSPPGAATRSARPLPSPPTAAAPRRLESILSAEVPVALDDLWADLIDHRDGLLIALHRSLGSQNFAVAAPPVAPAAAAQALAAADLVLSFTTPLPLVGLSARNTEALVARRTGPGAFSVASVCSTRGVPMAGAFINRLLWEAKASGTTTAHLSISACTEFTAPVLGLIRAQIERESLKGMRESYAGLADLLAARRPPRAATAVTNLRRPAAMSSPLESPDPPPPLQSDASESEGEDEEDEEEAPALALRRPRRRRRRRRPGAAPAPAGAGAADLEESDEDDDDVTWERRPHRATLHAFNSGDLAEIKRGVAARWPAWAGNRFWLLALGPHGGVRAVEGVPTPDEALGLLWAVGVATAGARMHADPQAARLPDWQTVLPKDPLVRGLLEAMRLVAPRVPSGAAAGDGRPRPPPAGDPAGAVSPAAVSSAMFVLGWLGGEGNWAPEMEALCRRLPSAEFPQVIHVYNAVWALRAVRHWTPNLPHLEARAVELLRGLGAGEGGRRLTTRHVRHAAFVAQALVHLGHVPRDIFGALAPVVGELWDLRAVCSLAWAVAIANELEAPLAGALLAGLEARAEDIIATGFPRRCAVSQLWQLFATMERLAPAAAARVAGWRGAAAELAAAARADWEHVVRVEQKHTSAAQREVFATLVALGYADAQLESTAAGLSVDVAVPGACLAVEVDGFAHFARNRRDMAVGNSLWKRRLLQAHGWTVVNVNVVEWMRTRGSGQRRALLRAAVEREGAAARAAGKAAKWKHKGKAWRGRRGGPKPGAPAAAAP